ncbi:MAG: hypothetical protein QNL04_10805 [SAR324 cluster bacterium]|nr:hypothetical protein [SAR324 cluster bacterium]
MSPPPVLTAQGSGKKQPLTERLCFVSLLERRQVEGIDLIRGLLESHGFEADHFHYHLSTKSEVSRPINPKNPQGPTKKITIEEKINVNGNLKGLRQFAWRAGKDPENVLLLQVERAKSTNALPLIFERIFENDGTVFITSAKKRVISQLCAKVDLEFSEVPQEIADNEDLLDDLISRSQRTRGMQSTAREVVDLSGLNLEIATKLKYMAQGKPTPLSDGEAVNILLLADAVTRYQEILDNFQAEVTAKKSPVPALCKMFEDLTSGIRASYLLKKFQDFLPKDAKAKTNGAIFNLLYQAIKAMDDGNFGKDPAKFNKGVLFARLNGTVIFARTQYDPALWAQCTFFPPPDEDDVEEGTREAMVEEMTSRLKEKVLHSKQSGNANARDIYTIHNLKSILSQRPTWIGDGVNPVIKGMIQSAIAKEMQLKLLPQKVEGKSYSLFSQQATDPGQLANSLHILSSAWGYYLSVRLEKAFEEFTTPGLDDLYKRFGGNFFDIMFYKVVIANDLPLNRQKFGAWVNHKNIIPNLREKGFITCDYDPDPCPIIKQEVWEGKGTSLFDESYGIKNFAEDYVNFEQELIGFITRIEKMSAQDENENNPAHYFLSLIKDGFFHFTSHDLRKKTRISLLYRELYEMVKNAASKIMVPLEASCINRKCLLLLPEVLSPLLFIGNEFDLRGKGDSFRVHLLTLPVKSAADLDGINKDFASSLVAALGQKDTSARKALGQAFQILKEFQKIWKKFYSVLSLSTLDQILTSQKAIEQAYPPMTAAHLKNFIPDDAKIAIGANKDIDFNKTCNFKSPKRQGKATPIELVPSNSSAQVLDFMSEAKKNVRDLLATMGIAKSMLKRVAPNLKASFEYKSYLKGILELEALLSEPVESITQKTLIQIERKGADIKAMADSSKRPDGIVTLIHKEWEEQNPTDAFKIMFYQVITSDKATNPLMVNLRGIMHFYDLFADKKVVIFYPEQGKQNQGEQFEQLACFLHKFLPGKLLFLDSSSLDEDQIKSLSRNFDPNLHFQGARLAPLPRKV